VCKRDFRAKPYGVKQKARQRFFALGGNFTLFAAQLEGIVTPAARFLSGGCAEESSREGR